MSIFKACDIRGVVGEEWNPADARRIGHSLGRMIRRRGEETICVGGDFRRSTPNIKDALIAGLLRTGLCVLDVGQVPTPVVYFAARRLECRNVAIVTASHNPGQYNGVKFLVAGRPGLPQLVDELQNGLDASEESHSDGHVRSHDLVAEYEPWIAQKARSVVAAVQRVGHVELGEPTRGADQHGPKGFGGVPERPLRIVLDAMEGAATLITPRVLESFGHSVTSLSDQIDPDFSARTPNPSSDANLKPLIESVVNRSADMGVALDGDGDRVIFVDHTGHIVRPEQIGVLLIRQCYDRPTVVYDLKCASILRCAAEATGGTALMQPSGHGFIKTTMIERQAELGVEVSGHHFFGVLGGGDDGLFTALVVLGLIETTGKSLADLIEPIGWPAITPDVRIPFTGDASAAVDRIAASCRGQVTRLDGVRAEYADGWALARASITEPAITFRFEARDREHLTRIASQFLAGVPELRREVMEMIE